MRGLAVEAREGTAGELVGALAAAKADVVVRIAPAARTIVRASTVPETPSAELAGAAELLAEAELPEALPTHRRCGAVFGAARGDGQRGVLCIGWMEDPTDEGLAATAVADGTQERWTTAPAALAALCLERGAAGFLQAGAGEDAGVQVAVAVGEGVVAARLTFEETSPPEAWWSAGDELVRAAARACEVEPPRSRQGGSGDAIVLSEEAVAALARRLTGVRDDARWIDTYGLALGAAMLGAERRPERASAAMLGRTAPRVVVPWPERAAAWISRPSSAAMVIGASVLVLLLAPLGIASARLSMLDARTQRLESQRETREALDRQEALYAQLQKSRWPMTKLLSDLSGATPVGVSITQLRLSPEQGVTILATATSSDQVNAFQAALNGTRIFQRVRVNRVESRGEGVEFDLSADVVQPHLAFKATEDFAATPLAVRLYGEGASNLAVAAPAPRGGRATRAATGGASSAAGGDAGSRRPGAEGAGQAAEPPAALTDAQINAMDRATAMREWTQRRVFSQRRGLEAATRDRLNQEVEKLRERMRQLPATSGGTP
jgi:Tfp pilus assembly protein PilN